MPVVLRYARSHVRVAKTLQRVRLAGVSVGGDGGEVFNLTSSFGNYARASRRGGTIRFAYTPLPAPFSYEHETDVTTTGGCSEPRFAWTPRQRLHLVYRCPEGTAERTSDDDGLTWSGETLTFTACEHPDITGAAEGTLLRASWVPASGKIQATRQYQGEVAASSPFFLKDAAAVDLVTEDDCFRLVADVRGWWWLHARLLAGGATSLLMSTDDGESFAVTSGAVTGITSGTHPGMAAGYDGTLWAWAYVAGVLVYTRREAGAVDWTTPANVLDAAAANLTTKDVPSSMALAWEGPGRVILATIYATHSSPSDWWAADGGASFTRFV